MSECGGITYSKHALHSIDVFKKTEQVLLDFCRTNVEN